MWKSNDLRKNFFWIFYLTSWFVTWGQKEGEIYLGPWNHDGMMTILQSSTPYSIMSGLWKDFMESVIGKVSRCRQASTARILQLFFRCKNYNVDKYPRYLIVFWDLSDKYYSLERYNLNLVLPLFAPPPPPPCFASYSNCSSCPNLSPFEVM